MRQAKPHWYHITYAYCPVCGAGSTYRERRYTEKPKDWQDRVEHLDSYDWCIERDGLYG